MARQRRDRGAPRRRNWRSDALHLQELTDIALDFDIEAIGFEPPEIDLRIQSLDPTSEDAADNFEVAVDLLCQSRAIFGTWTLIDCIAEAPWT
jgi:hypothetical protein